MEKPKRGPYASPGYHLWHAGLLWTRAITTALEPQGLTHTQFFVLASARWLGLSGPPPMQREVAELVGIDRNMTSQVVRTLEARGWLSREDAPEDTRAWRLRLTPEGERIFQAAITSVREVDARFFGALGKRLPTFVEELQRLRTAAGAPAGEE